MTNNQAGLTMLEIVIVSAIAVVVGTLLLGIFSNNTGIFNKQNAVVVNGLSLNDMMSDIGDVIRQAAVVVGGYPEVNPQYITSSKILVLKLNSYNAQGIVPSTYDYAVIARDSPNQNVLRLLIFTDLSSQRKNANKVLSSIMNDLTFRYLDGAGTEVVDKSLARQVETSLVVQSASGSATTKRSATITTSLNNYQY